MNLAVTEHGPRSVTFGSPVSPSWSFVRRQELWQTAKRKNVTHAVPRDPLPRCEVDSVDPSRDVSGLVDSLPAMVIESLAPGAEVTKTFQVFISETGTHAIEVELPSDALASR